MTNTKIKEDEIMTDKMKLSDDMMEQVSGGITEEIDTRTIKGMVMVNPFPDNPEYSTVWDDCQANGYTVYELTSGELAIAGAGLPELMIGDEVSVNAIRGYYGWEIEGVWDGR